MSVLAQLEEHIASGNWPLAAGRLVELIATTARASTKDPGVEQFEQGAEAMRVVCVESVRAAYRKIEMNDPPSAVIGTLLEGLKRFDVGELSRVEKDDAQISATD